MMVTNCFMRLLKSRVERGCGVLLVFMEDLWLYKTQYEVPKPLWHQRFWEETMTIFAC